MLDCSKKAFSARVSDLPVTTHTFAANQSRTLDIPAFAENIETGITESSLFAETDYVILVTEQMQGMGFKTPAKTLTMLAEMAGHIEAVVRMVCRYQEIPLFIRKYPPKIWTHWMFPESENRTGRKSEAKNESLQKAQELFLELQHQLNLKKHHDRAEALLLAFTALAELQGCIVDPKLKMVGKLVDTYLDHKQEADGKPLRLTDILYEEILPNGILLKEIKTRKENQNV